MRLGHAGQRMLARDGEVRVAGVRGGLGSLDSHVLLVVGGLELRRWTNREQCRSWRWCLGGVVDAGNDDPRSVPRP